MRVRTLLGALCLVGVFPALGQAATITFFNEAAFLASVGPTATFPTSGLGPSLTFDGISGNFSGQFFQVNSTPGPPINNLSLNDFTGVLPGREIAVAGADEVDIFLIPSVHSFGFRFAEPTSSTGPDSASPFVDSTFQVSLFLGMTLQGSFMFNAPNDVGSFVGVWSTLPFGRVEIRELTADPSDEFIGELFAGLTPLATPEPATLLLMATGIAGLLARRRRA